MSHYPQPQQGGWQPTAQPNQQQPNQGYQQPLQQPQQQPQQQQQQHASYPQQNGQQPSSQYPPPQTYGQPSQGYGQPSQFGQSQARPPMPPLPPSQQARESHLPSQGHGASQQHFQQPPPQQQQQQFQQMNHQMGNMNLNQNRPPMPPLPQQSQGYQPPPPPSQEPQMNGAQYNNMQQTQQYQPQSNNAPQQQQPVQPSRRPLIPADVVPIDPAFMQTTTGVWPNSTALKLKSHIPQAIVLTPLASVAEELPSVNFGACGVIRCKACRTYINPYVWFADGGSRWKCNMCGASNDVPSGYFSMLDQNGERADKHDRPELLHSSVEIIAPAEYTVRPPQPPSYVFVIDVSAKSIQNGMVQLAAETISECIDRLPGGERANVGFITFDSQVHYYALNPDAQQFQMYVCGDLTDVFPPVPDNLFVNLANSRDHVEAVLSSLHDMHKNTQDQECALGAALDAAHHIMSHVGGKMLVFVSTLPSVGPGVLKNREDARLLGTDQEHKLLARANDHYKNLAIKFTRVQISVDVFQFPNAFADVPTISGLAKYSAGQSFFYPYFSAQGTTGERFRADLSRVLLRTTGWEAVMRVRVSRGVRIQNFHGNFYLRARDLLALPNIDPDQSFAMELVHEDNTPTPIAGATCIQAALLYTTSTGERRIRVHTSLLPVSASLPDLMGSINCAALCNIMVKRSLEETLNKGLLPARELIQTTTLGILRAYRSSGQGQYLPLSTEADYPDHLRELPRYCLGMLKNIAFRDGSDVSADMRFASHAVAQTMNVADLEKLVNPYCLPVHELEHDASLGQRGQDGSVALPQLVNLSSDVVSSQTVHLIDNGREFILRVGRQVSPSFLSEVLGVQSLDGQAKSTLRVQESADPNDNSLRSRFNNILTYLRDSSTYYQTCTIVVEGDPSEGVFFNQLIEDRTMSVMSYHEFLTFVTRNTGV